MSKEIEMVTITAEEMVTITTKEYDRLLQCELKLRCLGANDIKNWHKYAEAMKEYERIIDDNWKQL